MEYPGDNDKEAKDYELDEETADDDVFAGGHARGVGAGGAHQGTPCGLHKEGEDVAGDKEFREEAAGDEGVRFAVGEEDDAAEDHVNRGGEKGGCHEGEEGLEDVGKERPFAGCFGSGYRTADVTDSLDCVTVSEPSSSRGRWVLTGSTDDKRNEVPRPSADHLDEVEYCGDGEEDNEDDRSCQRRRIAVKSEIGIFVILIEAVTICSHFASLWERKRLR